MVRCYGITHDGRQCGFSAGYGTDDEHFCYHHNDQELIETDDGVAVGRGPISGNGWAGYDVVHVEMGDGLRFEYDVSEVTD